MQTSALPLSSFLFEAAATGNTEVIREFIESGGDVNSRNLFQSQLLHVAAREGQVEVARLLIDSGANVNSLDYAGMRRTALHWACQQGHVEMVELLVDSGADTKARGKSWSKLVQGQRCGRLIDTEAPCGDPPEALCRSGPVRLALERPEWRPDAHRAFPERFREAARALLLASSRGRGAGAQRIPDDVLRDIVRRMAYPVSAWVRRGEWEAPGPLLR
uniref:Nacht and ankyrin domain protein n=1 Tax=Tetraselmis sp. GSL018 TaxID=582737 RepID=A0A061RFX2_9CHLO